MPTDESNSPQAATTGPGVLSPPTTSKPSSLAGPRPPAPGSPPELVPSPRLGLHTPAEHSWFARAIHDYIRSYITLADQKAAFFFASATALLVFLYKDHAVTRWLKDPRTWTAADLCSCLAVVGLAATSLVTISVVAPRLKGSQRGRVFWEAIAEYPDSASYAKDISAAPTADLVADMLQHSFDLAQVCRRKYRALQRALWTGGVGLLATIAYLLVG